MVKRIRDLTLEDLDGGAGLATELDLQVFKAACERCVCDRPDPDHAAAGECLDEAQAIEYVWNEGQFDERLAHGHCIYCHMMVKESDAPSQGDEEGWSRIAGDRHAQGCEWVETRAPRQFKTESGQYDDGVSEEEE